MHDFWKKESDFFLGSDELRHRIDPTSEFRPTSMACFARCAWRVRWLRAGSAVICPTSTSKTPGSQRFGHNG
ncbi:hypothetical protein ACQR18_25470 [Bradyrhizobium oligotrophicum]|uniref:hypothetical protein n=1 Tax=Bradyrhizobium oligotrophicum TaxID=44255 RepID=UPI003EB89317